MTEYKAWTDDEESRLLKRFREGMEFRQLASIHGRTKASIIARLVRLGAMHFDNDTLKASA